MGECKKDITPLLTHWSYVFLASTHRYDLSQQIKPFRLYLQRCHSSLPKWQNSHVSCEDKAINVMTFFCFSVTRLNTVRIHKKVGLNIVRSIHCGRMSIINIGSGKWLDTWRLQAITCNNVDLSSVRSCENHRRLISQEIHQLPMTKISFNYFS